MDKNTAIGLALMVGLLVAYQFFNAPSDEELAKLNEAAKEAETTQTIEVQERQADVEIIPALADSASQVEINTSLVRDFGRFAPAAEGNEEIIELSNGQLNLTFNSKGGFVQSAKLDTSYVPYWDRSKPISLWDEDLTSWDIPLTIPGTGLVHTRDLFFKSDKSTNSNGDQVLSMKAQTSNPGSYLEYVYTLPANSYEVRTEVRFEGMEDILAQNRDGQPVDWKMAGWHNEKSISYERQHSSIFYCEMGDSRSYLSEAREDDEVLEDPLNWLSYKQFFFSAALISPEGFKPGTSIKSYPPINEEDTLHTMMYESRLLLPTEVSKSEMVPLTFYLGINELENLNATGVNEIGRIIDYGPSIFGWVNRNMIRPMFGWLSSKNIAAGIIILLITLAIKLLLFPITWKNYLSSAKMRVLKPDIEEINKKYEGKDAMEKQQAVMGLYKKTGVNPLAGCLPMVLQMPILYAMFRFFPATIELRQKSFLWAEDLVNYDSILNLGFEIPLYGSHVSGFTVLMAASTFFYTRMSSGQMAQPTQPGMPNMKVIMSLFPFMMLFFFNNYASGLSLYYLLANVISIVQMIIIKNYIIDEDKIRDKIESNKTKKRKKSKWSERLQEAQRLQQGKVKQKNAK